MGWTRGLALFISRGTSEENKGLFKEEKMKMSPFYAEGDRLMKVILTYGAQATLAEWRERRSLELYAVAGACTFSSSPRLFTLINFFKKDATIGVTLLV